MPAMTVEPKPMGRKSTAPKTTPVRLTDEAVRWARIASGYTGESVAEYVSRLVAQYAKADVDRLHAETIKPEAKRTGRAARSAD